MNLATTSVYLLSPAPTKTVVRAPRLIARASTKSGTGVGEEAVRVRRSVQGLQTQREGDEAEAFSRSHSLPFYFRAVKAQSGIQKNGSLTSWL